LGRVDQLALAGYHYRAVLEVLGGSPIGEVAECFETMGVGARPALAAGRADAAAADGYRQRGTVGRRPTGLRSWRPGPMTTPGISSSAPSSAVVAVLGVE